MKKILILICVFIYSFFSFGIANAGDCVYTEGSISSELTNCLSNTTLVKSGAKIIGGNSFYSTITSWTKNIALYLGIGAVLGIVYGAFMMTISAGEDEKINKAKDIIKWSIIGFLGLILASFIINVVAKVIYSIS